MFGNIMRRRCSQLFLPLLDQLCVSLSVQSWIPNCDVFITVTRFHSWVSNLGESRGHQAKLEVSRIQIHLPERHPLFTRLQRELPTWHLGIPRIRTLTPQLLALTASGLNDSYAQCLYRFEMMRPIRYRDALPPGLWGLLIGAVR